MNVETWPLSHIRPYPKNARNIPQSAIDKVAASLREYGWRQPMCVEPDGTLIVGHVRFAGALQNGWTEGPVNVAHDLTPAQIKAYRLFDNRSHDETTWNFELLGPELIDLKALDFDLKLTGFEMGQIDQLTQDGNLDPGWQGLPEFEQQNLMPKQTLYVHFATNEDRQTFADLVGQPLTDETRSIWYPQAARMSNVGRRFVSTDQHVPRYPLYIISKGRWESRLTSKSLEQMGTPYYIVVEPQEYGEYAAVIDPAKILTLPFTNLGQGSIPARNWVWEHAINQGHKRHWIIDDNIQKWYRFNHNDKIPVDSGVPFCVAEDFADRFTNVGLGGFQYEFFVPRKAEVLRPYTLNTRVYSCILVDNCLPFRWRGRYNEDTDLSLRVLKSGLCTFYLNSFLAKKIATMHMTGGNTDELYQGDGRLKMAESLQQQHPDVVRITKKWGRWQHQVDYRPFANNKLIPNPAAPLVPEGPNEYGMHLEENYSSV